MQRQNSNPFANNTAFGGRGGAAQKIPNMKNLRQSQDALARLNPFGDPTEAPRAPQSKAAPKSMAAMQNLRDQAVSRQQAKQTIHHDLDPFAGGSAQVPPPQQQEQRKRPSSQSFDPFVAQNMAQGGAFDKPPARHVQQNDNANGNGEGDPFDLFGTRGATAENPSAKNFRARSGPSLSLDVGSLDYFSQSNAPQPSPISTGLVGAFGESNEQQKPRGHQTSPLSVGAITQPTTRMSSSDSIDSNGGLRKPKTGRGRRRASSSKGSLTREPSSSMDYFAAINAANDQAYPDSGTSSPFEWGADKTSSSPVTWGEEGTEGSEAFGAFFDNAAARHDQAAKEGPKEPKKHSSKGPNDSPKTKKTMRLQCPNCSKSIVPPDGQDMFKCSCGQVMVVPGTALALKIQKQGTIKGHLCFVQDKSTIYGTLMLRVTSKKVFSKWSERFCSVQDGFILMFRSKLGAAQGVTAESSLQIRRLQHSTGLEVSSDKSCNMLYAFSVVENYATRPEHEIAISKMKAFNQSVPSRVSIRVACYSEDFANKLRDKLQSEIDKQVEKGV